MIKPSIEDLLADILAAHIGERPHTEYRFCTERMWRLDCAYPTQKLGIEIDGRQHARDKQRNRDCEKQNFLIEDGWKILRYPAKKVLAKCRQPLIAEQVARVLMGVCDRDCASCVLS